MIRATIVSLLLLVAPASAAEPPTKPWYSRLLHPEDPKVVPINHDTRPDFDAGLFIGYGVDTFSGRQDVVDGHGGHTAAGVHFDYRLLSDGAQQVWISGETVHGTRGAEAEIDDFSKALRNAKTLSAGVSIRGEFLRVANDSSAPSSLYVRVKAGVSAVDGLPNSFREYDASVGLMVVDGGMKESYLEAGWGTDTALGADPHRWSVAATLVGGRVPIVSLQPFIGIQVELGQRDSLRSVAGIRFQIGKLWP